MATPFDKEFFEDLLRKHYNNPGLKVFDYSAKSAVPKGENYASFIWRVSLYWQSKNDEVKEEKIIIKSHPEGQWLKTFVTEGKLFETEAAYYQVLIPIYKKLYKNRTGKEIHFGAKNYKTERTDLLILEDISPAGFRLADRKEGGSYQHGALVFKALAKLHAFSIAAYREDPSFAQYELFKDGFYTEKNIDILDKFYQEPIQEFLRKLETLPKFQNFIGKIKPQTSNDLINYAKYSGKLRVMVQGDCWLTNMLFRLEDKTNTPIEVCLLDYQLVHWGPLAFDLVYFMYTSLAPETISDHKNDLFEIYIKELHSWLNILGEGIGDYSKENILKDIREEEKYGVGLACTALKIMMAESEDAPSFDNIENLELTKLENNPRYHDRLLKLFKIFDKDGLL